MTHTTDHATAAALKTATPADGYKITPTTAAILDCIRATDELASIISDVMETLHGDDVDAANAPYFEHCTAITDMLHVELTRRIIGNISDVKNSHDANVIKL